MSAVVKENHIETIFDYDLSAEEIELIALGMSFDEYMSCASEHDIYLDMATLFGMRGDKKTSARYLSHLDSDFVKTHIKWDALVH